MSELFECWDDAGEYLGLVPRDEVHARGLWHRSAHVLLFNGRDELLIQQRSPGKDIYPNRWDLSVGEHAQPGESFEAAARRGLAEELGVHGVRLTPLLDVRRASHRLPELGVHDCELQQSFRAQYDGPVRADPAEVAAVAWIGLSELSKRVRAAPDDFTPWFLAELDALALLPG
ncbi:MAG TPA: NUDIX domain-containing protein [Pseudomonadales bacterium]